MRPSLRRILERRIDDLPVTLRTVFMMREVEGMSVQETAECLGTTEATVRRRLTRARALLRDALLRDVHGATQEMFGFAGGRCDRLVATVQATRDAALVSGRPRGVGSADPRSRAR